MLFVLFEFIDLFAGAGGLSEGLEEAGFHGIFASEIVPQYAETYRKEMDRVFGDGSCRILKVRELGAVRLLAGDTTC